MRLTVFEKNYSSLKCTCFADYFFFKKRFNSLFDFFFMAPTLSSSSHSAILASYNEKNFFNFLHLFYEIFSLFVLYVEKRGSSSPLPRKLWWISSKLFLLFFAPSKKISIWKHLKRIPFTPTFLLLRSVTRRAKKSVSVQRNSGRKIQSSRWWCCGLKLPVAVLECGSLLLWSLSNAFIRPLEMSRLRSVSVHFSLIFLLKVLPKINVLA